MLAVDGAKFPLMALIEDQGKRPVSPPYSTVWFNEYDLQVVMEAYLSQRSGVDALHILGHLVESGRYIEVAASWTENVVTMHGSIVVKFQSAIAALEG